MSACPWFVHTDLVLCVPATKRQSQLSTMIGLVVFTMHASRALCMLIVAPHPPRRNWIWVRTDRQVVELNWDHAALALHFHLPTTRQHQHRPAHFHAAEHFRVVRAWVVMSVDMGECE